MLFRSIDYVVTKLPRFAFEKFPGADVRLTTQMKSVGEVMAIGRSFTESLGKAMRGLETGSCGFDFCLPDDENGEVSTDAFLQEKLAVPGAERLWWVGEALRAGWSEQRVVNVTRIDPWFIREITAVIALEAALCGRDAGSLTGAQWREAKREGISDLRLAELLVTDAVINPPETEFIKRARSMGAKTLTGLGMLVYQAAIAIEIWSGCYPDCTVMKEALIKEFELE